MIVLVIGLPGSGKTHYLSSLSDDQWLKIDDPMENITLPISEKNIAIADVNFIFPDVLEKAKQKLVDFYGDVVIDYVYFENNPDKCLNNAKHRNDGRKVENFIKSFHKYYNPPSNALKIWQG